MRTERALEIARHRDAALAQVLAVERDTGWPPPFDWRAWRLNRETLAAKLRADWQRFPRARVVHSPVDP